MKNTVLKYGVISGLVSTTLMLATFPFLERIGDYGAYVGYTGILISFLFVYFGVRAYRDSQPGRPLTFAAAFNVGLLITLISCVFYVATWLVMYYQFMPDFADKYAARIVEGLRAKGAPQTQIDEAIKQGVQLKALLANPFMNAAMTFTEPFPVGLLVTLVSAATLRRKAE